MPQITRLKDAEISNGNLINADDLDAEFNQLVSESNSQDTELTSIGTGTYTFSGVKTFSSNPKTNGIDERTASTGVTVDGVLLKDGFIKPIPTTQPYVPAANGEIGYDSTNHFYKGMQNGSILTFGSGVKVVTARSSNTILATGDRETLFACTSTFTQTLTAAATLGNGWYCYIANVGSGVITIDPNASELVDGFSTINIGPGNNCILICDGTGFYTVGRRFEQILLENRQTNGNDAGTPTGASWNKLDLNTEVIDTANNCSLASGVLTLQPGTYLALGNGVNHRGDTSKLRLRNTSDSVSTLIGMNSYSASAGVYAGINTNLTGQFTITAAKNFELQAWYESGTTNALGIHTTDAEIEVYASLELLKLR